MTTAWELLQQEWKLPQPHVQVLTVLLNETPVALRGEEALAPLSKLRLATPSPAPERHRMRSMSENAELFELLQKSRRIEYPGDRFIGFSFVSELAVVENSQFLRYRLSPGLISALQAIKQQFKLQSLV